MTWKKIATNIGPEKDVSNWINKNKKLFISVKDNRVIYGQLKNMTPVSLDIIRFKNKKSALSFAIKYMQKTGFHSL